MGIFTGHITVKQKREKGKRRKLPPPDFDIYSHKKYQQKTVTTKTTTFGYNSNRGKKTGTHLV